MDTKKMLPYLGVVLLALLIFALVGFTSPGYEKCIQHHKATDTAARCFFDALHESHGVITALATIVIGVFTLTLWRATSKLGTLAENQDRYFRISERAYLFCGGVQGVPKEDPQPLHQMLRPRADYYDPPWRMGIFNWGRTPAFVTKVQWGVCPESEFPKDMLVSNIIKEKRLSVRAPVNIQEAFPPTTGRGQQYRHVEPGREVGTVFFGRVDYRDIFGEPHHSTFSLLHREHHTDSIGESYSKDWS
jgi:hypothetical protein